MKKILTITVYILISAASSHALYMYPLFDEYNFTIKIPTNTVGCLYDKTNVFGSNIVYNLTGQVFTNAATSRIRTVAEGFGSIDDKSTPWRTITQMLYISQTGAASNSIASLYSSDSQPYIDSIYTNKAMLAKYKEFSTSITNMQALLGYKTVYGFIAITSIKTKDSSAPDILPFYLVKTNLVSGGCAYLLSSFDNSNPRDSNIGVFLNINPAMNLLK